MMEAGAQICLHVLRLARFAFRCSGFPGFGNGCYGFEGGRIDPLPDENPKKLLIEKCLACISENMKLRCACLQLFLNYAVEQTAPSCCM